MREEVRHEPERESPVSSARSVHPIEAESYRILAERVDLSGFGPLGRDVVARVVHASADPEFALSMFVDEDPLEAAVEALRGGARVVTDVKMVGSGLSCGSLCYLDDLRPEEHAGRFQTRSAHAMSIAAEQNPSGAIFVVGCAPTALDELVRLADAEWFEPVLVVGMPVGFVGAAQSKEALRHCRLPSVSNAGEKGGSAVAAAAVNALVHVARGRDGGGDD